MGKVCSGLARKLLVLVVLCAIICLLADVTNAKPKKFKRKKKHKKRRKSRPKLDVAANSVTLPNEVDRPLLDVDNSVTLPNELDRPVKTSPKSLDPPTEPKKPKKPKLAVSDKPHIIFVIADDLGYNDVGYHTKGTGCVARTPTINALAYSGVRLENYYVQHICTPTRASLLTGRYPIRMGLQHGNIDPTDPTCLPSDETTLPEKLRDLGYATHAVGKWHLGFSRTNCLPTRRGFDSFLGIVLGSSSHYSHDNNKAKALYSNESAEFDYEGTHSSELYTDRAVEIIKRHDKNVPLFMYLSYQAVHSPIQSPEKYQAIYKKMNPGLWQTLKKTEGNSSQERIQYLGLLESIDAGLETLIRTLKKTRLWKNTVLVFTSDNGGRNSYSASNWPLRGQKNTLWEGGIKGVGFVNSPLLHPKVVGTVQNGLMHVSDWFPTLIEGVAGGFAGGRLPIDGINMWPTIAKGSPSPRWEILHNIDPFNRNSRKFKKKFPTPKRHDRWRPPKPLVFDPLILAAIRYDDWKLITGYQNIKYSGWVPPLERLKKEISMTSFDDQGIYVRLYDISTDPEEKINVAVSNPHIVHKLLNRLRYHNENAVYPKHHLKDPAGKPRSKHPGEVLIWKPWLQ